MDPYDVALIQSVTHVVRTPQDRDEVVDRNLDRIAELINFACNRMGEVKLAVTGEYSLMGQFRPRSLERWLEIAVPIPNRFTERMGAIAQRYGCYLTGHLLERIDQWPDRYFNTELLFSPSGDIVLTYRKYNGPNNLNTTYTSPGEIYSEYVARFGVDALFPVADTAIGRIGIFVCGDVQYPEMARCLAFKGADILLHPTAEIYRRAHEGWEAMRRARAAENGVYVLSCTTGGFLGTDRPVDGYRGRSQVLGPDGMILAIADGPGEAVVTCSVDVDRLRWRKTRFGASGHIYNPMVLLRTDLFAAEYARAKRWPNDGFLHEPIRSTADTRALAQSIAERLIAEGKILRPEA